MQAPTRDDAPDYPATWYAASIDPPPPRPSLAGRSEAEVCVVGGGLAGLTTALELARRGRSVVLLEARRLGWSASGRNGGFVSPGFALGLGDLGERIGVPQAEALYRLSLEGHEHVRRLLAELAPEAHMGEGWLTVLRHPDRAGGLAAYRDRLAGLGLDCELWPAERTRGVLKSARYHEALLMPQAFHIHPLRYLLALAEAAEQAGARIAEASPVLTAGMEGGRHWLATPQGRVTARHVVVAISAHDRHLFPALGRAVLPVATYVAVTEPLGKVAAAAIATPAAISDTRRAGDYYRRIGEGRILWGGRITTRTSEPARLAEAMRGDMVSVYPQLGAPRIDFAWSGLMGYARHKMPLLGEASPGLWLAAGFGGHGLNTTAMAGLLLARAIAGEDDAVRRFGVLGSPWVGGPLGRAGVQASYWLMQLKDRLDERHGRRGA